ncbi:MAG TPA: FAD-binding oxidoreductase [Solirubrobacteraceae bacterium]|nr:FAD-binding oxidoreductase [Solirubrobacteraceae bacterium]
MPRVIGARAPTGPAPGMRWWGWGSDAHVTPWPPGAERLLHEEIAWRPRATAPVALDDVALPARALPARARELLCAAVGAEHVRDDRLARVSHAVGRSYTDLLRIRSGDGSTAPDAVVAPARGDQVTAVLAACAKERIAVVPFGGGTSVVGGVETVRDGFAGAIALNLRRLTIPVEVDRDSLLATLPAGLDGPAAEAALGAHGLTLGHFPQSYEHATIGGFVATRSAGQNSTGYGRVDELVRGLHLVAPAGEVEVMPVPASAAGPPLRELLVGSEGALGVIPRATLRVRRLPPATRAQAWAFPSFAAGAEAFRALEQAGGAPTIARLSDEHETRLTLGLTASGSSADRVGRRLLRAAAGRGPCLAILGWEGEPRAVRLRALGALRTVRAHDAVPLGSGPAVRWCAGRFEGPYLRDALLDRGVLVETLETATAWSGLAALHAAVGGALRAALSARGTPPLVACHISHLYATGASLYFTVIARQEPGAELEQWRAAKASATEVIVARRATITHHHAVGRDHLPWLEREIGPTGLAVLRAVKDRLDPTGIMNPGKLLPAR